MEPQTVKSELYSHLKKQFQHCEIYCELIWKIKPSSKTWSVGFFKWDFVESYINPFLDYFTNLTDESTLLKSNHNFLFTDIGLAKKPQKCPDNLATIFNACSYCYCYTLIQRFRVTCFIAGQRYTYLCSTFPPSCWDQTNTIVRLLHCSG